MLQETSERNDGPVPRLEAKGTGSVNSVPTSAQKIVIIGSPFIRTGSITMENHELRIIYEAFGRNRSVFISAQDLGPLVRDRFAPAAPIQESDNQAGGVVITCKVGYACRSVSGKALKISTTTSGGELMVPWANFVKVVNGTARSAPVSRIERQMMECPPSIVAVLGHNIRKGLTGGF